MRRHVLPKTRTHAYTHMNSQRVFQVLMRVLARPGGKHTPSLLLLATSGDIFSIELMACVNVLGNLTGETSPERVFELRQVHTQFKQVHQPNGAACRKGIVRNNDKQLLSENLTNQQEGHGLQQRSTLYALIFLISCATTVFRAVLSWRSS